MGWGDEIIASGQARKLHEQHEGKRKVVVVDAFGQLRRHEIWKNNPRISDGSAKNPVVLKNGPGCRPYIKEKTERKWVWKEFECPVGELYFSQEELAFAAPYSPMVILEPNLKQQASPNKHWGVERWKALAVMLRQKGIKLAQFHSAIGMRIRDAQIIEAPSFRHAAAVLARARLAILHEGGLHHAAAAVGVKSIVLFGGFISPKQTGYATQSNFFTGGEPCGMRVLCTHCAKAMKAIEPEAVAAEAVKLLGGA